MEELTYVHVGSTGKIVRRSVFTFLQYYEYFTTTPVFLILPFSASILLSQSLSASFFAPLLNTHASLRSLFSTMGFSRSSQFLSLLNIINLSQTHFTSTFTLFFAFTSLLLGKLFIIQALIHQRPFFQVPFSSFTSLYKPLFLTQLCNSGLIIFINVNAFSLLFAAFNTLNSFGYTTNNPLPLIVSKAILYTILANVSVICNLALVVAGWGNCSGFAAIHKACCLLSWKRSSIIFSMILPINLGMLAVEGLFRYRVVRADHIIEWSGFSLAMEGVFIAYLYSLLIVLDTIASCLFFKSTKEDKQIDYAKGRYYFQIKIVKKEDQADNVPS
ncbi:hypothetical protein RHGRI_028485 [Rhododendron griersonianum]|uniref:Transmembrane protein n=1 Tax=Rhododendron griersonianum TaxID=479676 RepID=A0AAV6IIB9_9ERIC|nr:hypothetical protein RHGRI_028485 [Rhododendron griersonianum]